jgi:hypothetical protein
VAQWPLQLVAINLAIVYLSAFYSKLYLGGMAWAKGEYLRNYLLELFIQNGDRLPLLIARHSSLCAFLSCGMLLFEGTFFLVIFRSRLRKWLIASGILIHISIFLIMGLNFLKVFMLGYLAFPQYDKYWEGALKSIHKIRRV